MCYQYIVMCEANQLAPACLSLLSSNMVISLENKLHVHEHNPWFCVCCLLETAMVKFLRLTGVPVLHLRVG